MSTLRTDALQTLDNSVTIAVEDITTEAAVDVKVNAVRADLANSSDPAKGAALVGYKTRTLASRFDEQVNVKDFGATGDGTTDDTAAINAAITFCNTLPRASLVIPEGTYVISSVVTFDIPDFSEIIIKGRFRVVTAGGLKFGSAVRNVFGHTITGIDIRRDTIATNGAQSGCELANMAFSSIEIKRVNNFPTGVFCTASQPNGGFSYNQLYLGLIHDNQYNLALTATGSGYTNENVFNGGSFNHSSGYPVVDIANILMINNPAHPLNNNRFMFPSLEDSQAAAVACRMEGVANVLFMPRLENPGNLTGYPVVLASNTQECYVRGAYGMNPSNISDSGLYNTVETQQGIYRKSQGTLPIQRLQNLASSNNKLHSGLNSAGTETSSIDGNGNAIFNTAKATTYFGPSVGVGIFFGSGSPEGVVTAAIGSLFLNQTTGSGQVLYVKQTGVGNTGWVLK